MNDAGKTPVVATCANGARGRGFLARALAHGKVMISIETGSEGERTIKSGQSCDSKTSIPAWKFVCTLGRTLFRDLMGQPCNCSGGAFVRASCCCTGIVCTTCFAVCGGGFVAGARKLAAPTFLPPTVTQTKCVIR